MYSVRCLVIFCLCCAGFLSVNADSAANFLLKGTVTAYDPQLKILKGLPGVTVTCMSQNAPGYCSFFYLLDSTDENGAYSLEGMSGWDYTMNFSKKGYQSWTVWEIGGLWATLTSDTVINITMLPLEANFSLKGSVTSLVCPSSPFTSACRIRPIPGCSVTVADYGFSGVPVTTRTTPYLAITDSAGDFSFDSIPMIGVNQFRVHVSNPAYSTADSIINVAGNGIQVTADFRLDTLPGSTVVNGMKYTISTDKSWFDGTDSIRARYTILNTSSVTDSLRINGCATSMVITGQTGDTLYWNLQNQSCPGSAAVSGFSPGDSMVFVYPGYLPATCIDSVLTVSAMLNGYPASLASITILNTMTATPVVRSDLSGIGSDRVYFSMSRHVLVLTLDKPQMVSITASLLNGRSVGDLCCSRYFDAGVNEIRVMDGHPLHGVLIMKIKGERFEELKRINIPDYR